MELALIIFLTITIIYLELPALIKGRLWKEVIVFAVLLAFGLFLAVAQVSHMQLPNPIKGIEYLFKPVSDFVDKTLS